MMKFFVAMLAGLLFAAPAFADWESTLKATFSTAKVVETFDNLQDWTTNGWNMSGSVTGAFDPTYAPKKSDGTASQWSYWNIKQVAMQVSNISGTWSAGNTVTGQSSGAAYTLLATWTIDGVTYFQLNGTPYTRATYIAGETIANGSGATATFDAWPKVIANHGLAYIWRGEGKSLQMNVGNNNDVDDMAGIGAQRLGVYYGDGTPKSGYKKAHIFMMVKFPANFVLNDPSGSGIYPFCVFKFFDTCSGFTSIDTWGTESERAQIWTGSARYPQLTSEYGPNMSIMDIKGGSSFPNKLFYYESPFVAKSVAGGLDYNDLPTVEFSGNLNVATPFEAGQWFGIEAAFDIGTQDTADGSAEFWIYDQAGNVIAHETSSNVTRLTFFDHFYNKMTLGGNFLGITGGVNPPNTDGRWWYDDVIINGDRIGPTYFTTLANYEGGGDVNAPVISNTSPSGTLAAGTTSTTLSLTTDEAATCRVSQSSSTGYDAATNLTTTGGTSHSMTVSGLTDGGSYARYVWCRDAANNTSNYTTISWSVASAAPVAARPFGKVVSQGEFQFR